MKKSLSLLFCTLFCCSVSFAFVSQTGWRWRNNNGNESTATWRAAVNTPVTIASADTMLRLRIQLENANAESKGINTSLQYASAPDGPWHYVTSLKGNNAFVMANTNTYVTDLANTTSQISASTKVFSQGKVFVRTTTLAQTMEPGTFTEYEYCFFPTKNIAPKTTYYFRVPTGGDNPASLASLTTADGINTRSKLLTNGSFEDALKDWDFKVGSGATANASLIQTEHKDGINALNVKVSKVAGTLSVSLAHKQVALKVGQTYLVRFWAKAKQRSAAMKLAVKGNRTLTYDYKLYTGWQEFQFAFKAQDAAAKLGFLFLAATEYSIDHIEILDEKNEAIDVPMNYMWQNKRNPNEYAWLSADGVYSEPLPDGRTVWTCSDGWYGYNDTTSNSMNTHQLLRNTLIVQDAARPDGNLVTKIAGTAENPKSLMIPPDPQGHDDFFWPRDMIVENDSLKILLPDTRQLNAGDPVTYGNREAIGIFSLPDLKLRSIEYMPFIDSVQYGTLLKADDGYTYAYSKHEINPFEGHAIVARFPTGQLSVTTPWQFLTDTGWSYDYHNSKEIADAELYSVARLGPNHYVSVFMNPSSDKMEAEFAQSPIGPWVGRTIVGQIEGQADIFTYFGVMHEETAKNGVYTMSYSNIGDIGQMLDDKTVYWPTFIKADLKNLSPFDDALLPVKMKEFTAKAENNKVFLQWKTVTEFNNDRFEIERSADGNTHWAKIASVNSKGNSLEAQQYATYDVQPLQGNNYYRLNQVDKDGNSSVSGVRLVKMNVTRPVVKVYPNPAKSDVYIQLENYSAHTVQVQVTDMNGKIIFTGTISVQSNGTYKLPFTTKPSAGMYTVQVKGDALNEAEKIIIQ